MISDVDHNNNGCIEFDEFLLLMAKKAQDINSEDELIESFKVFDRDGNGLIGESELK